MDSDLYALLCSSGENAPRFCESGKLPQALSQFEPCQCDISATSGQCKNISNGARARRDTPVLAGARLLILNVHARPDTAGRPLLWPLCGGRPRCSPACTRAGGRSVKLVVPAAIAAVRACAPVAPPSSPTHPRPSACSRSPRPCSLCCRSSCCSCCNRLLSSPSCSCSDPRRRQRRCDRRYRRRPRQQHSRSNAREGCCLQRCGGR